MQERRKNWRTLQYLAGLDVARLDADHHAELEALQRQYKEAVGGARILARLDRPGDVRAGGFVQRARVGRLRAGATAFDDAADRPRLSPAAARRRKGQRRSARVARRRGRAKCTNCKTCYQEVPELFEKTQIVVDGEAKEVGHLIPGALAKVKVTPELKAKLARVAANCDAEIIHVH